MRGPYAGYPRHRENRENGQKKSLSGKTQGIWKFCQNTGKTQGIVSKHRENTGNFVSSSCKCSDSKSKGYCDSCPEKIHFFPEARKVCQVSSVYVILSNDVNWHRENLRSDRENTWKTQGI